MKFKSWRNSFTRSRKGLSMTNIYTSLKVNDKEYSRPAFGNTYSSMTRVFQSLGSRIWNQHWRCWQRARWNGVLSLISTDLRAFTFIVNGLRFAGNKDNLHPQEADKWKYVMADYFPVVNANESLLTLYDPTVDHFMSILNSTPATFKPCANAAPLKFHWNLGL